MRTLIGAVGTVVVFATTAGTALAGGDYNTPGAVAGEQTGGGGGSSLPFTGADLALYAVVGIAIVASGLTLRVMARRPS
jgi:hypothetical protein